MADKTTAPDAAQREALAANFRSITASTADAAVFFLESHGWNLDAAIESFFDADEEPEEAPPAAAPPVAAAPRPSAPPPAAAASKKPSGSGGGGGSGRIRTLADLNRGGGSDSEDDEDEPTEYYAGGEKSGMLVQDPSKGNRDVNRDVDSLFEQARQMGATAGPPLDHHSSSSSRSFTGTGRLLSGDSVAPAPPAPQQSDNVAYTISFWTNGFTIDDGPLRRFDDPENASFLESIAKSECPRELAPTDRRTGVSVNLVRKNEKYQEPKRSTAFQGVGRTLGDGSASSSATVQPTVTTAALSTASDSSIGLSVNPSLPSTSVQLRLADGTRMVARFNTSHTVGHIRAFIDASRPGASRTYQLQTVGFPPKQLADQTQTIEQAGLANSVVVQRL